MATPSMSARTWMATLAVEVSFTLPLLLTSVCVNRPASSDALTYSSLLEGVFIFPERIVTQSLVLAVCSIDARLDVENANCAAGWPFVCSATPFTSAFMSGPMVCVDFPHDASTTSARSGIRDAGCDRCRTEEPEQMRWMRPTNSDACMTLPLRPRGGNDSPRGRASTSRTGDIAVSAACRGSWAPRTRRETHPSRGRAFPGLRTIPSGAPGAMMLAGPTCTGRSASRAERPRVLGADTCHVIQGRCNSACEVTNHAQQVNTNHC